MQLFMLWNFTTQPVSPVIADSIFCDLIKKHLCTCNLVHGFWSLGKSNKEGSWQWGIAQSSILLGQEPVYYQESWVAYEKQWKSDYPQHIQTVAVCRDVHVWSPAISVQGLPR